MLKKENFTYKSPLVNVYMVHGFSKEKKPADLSENGSTSSVYTEVMRNFISDKMWRARGAVKKFIIVQKFYIYFILFLGESSVYEKEYSADPSENGFRPRAWGMRKLYFY